MLERFRTDTRMRVVGGAAEKNSRGSGAQGGSGRRRGEIEDERSRWGMSRCAHAWGSGMNAGVVARATARIFGVRHGGSGRLAGTVGSDRVVRGRNHEDVAGSAGAEQVRAVGGTSGRGGGTSGRG